MQSTPTLRDTLGSGETSQLKRGVHDVVEINRHIPRGGAIEMLTG